MEYFSNEDKQNILKLKKVGLSSREICKTLGWKETRKSSVNFFIERNKLQKDVVLPKKEIELEKAKAKILFYDIETTLKVSYHWNQWQENISMQQCIQESHLLSHAWAWGDGEVVGSILTKEEVLANDPERLVIEAWALFDNADIIVGHNMKAFDIRKINAYFLYYGLPPPSPYKVIDTLKIVKKSFKLPFNSLKYVAEYLNVTQKIDNSGVKLWIGCSQGDQKSLDEMLEYNIGDIETTRAVYKKLISWDNQGVNVSTYNNDSEVLCTHCGSDNIVGLNGKYAHTVQQKYAVYRCQDCKAVLRGNIKHNTKNKLSRVINT